MTLDYVHVIVPPGSDITQQELDNMFAKEIKRKVFAACAEIMQLTTALHKTVEDVGSTGLTDDGIRNALSEVDHTVTLLLVHRDALERRFAALTNARENTADMSAPELMGELRRIA